MAKAKLTFMGGIHPYDGKDLSKDKPMKAVLPKGDLVFPLSQHIGAPAVCLVSEGMRVKRGDLIGEIPEKAMGARVHASIDGVVESVADGMITIKA